MHPMGRSFTVGLSPAASHCNLAAGFSMTTTAHRLLLAACLLFASATTRATLVGDPVRLVVDTPYGIVFDQTAMVGSGIEFQVPGEIASDFFSFEMDFDSATLRFVFRALSGAAGDYGGTLFDPLVMHFSGLGAAGPLGGLLDVVLADSSFPQPIGLSFTADSATFTFGSDNLFIPVDGHSARFDLVTRAVAVPDPGSLALACCSLLGLAYRRWSR